MDKITRQVRIEHWTQIMNECLNSGKSSNISTGYQKSPHSSGD